MKINLCGKLCLPITFISLLIILLVRVYSTVLSLRSNLDVIQSKVAMEIIQDKDKIEYVAFIEPGEKNKNDKGIKYILQWTSPNNMPFKEMGKGQQVFIERHCKHQNCFVTSDRKYFNDITKFDVIAFSAAEVGRMSDSEFPTKRSPLQKFVFVSRRSAIKYPLCSQLMEGFFNWTWTYKLDSEIKFVSIVIRDINGNIIWPYHEMDWIKPMDMKPVNEDMKRLFKGKTKTMISFISDCDLRERYDILQEEVHYQLQKLNKSHQIEIDIYGTCGDNRCSNESACGKIIEKDYFFVLSIDNVDEDNANVKILNALQNKAIPIVLGTANYSRFMPEHSYLNMKELGVVKLAKKMNELMNDIDKYAEYFKWTNHYKYERGGATEETDDYCGLCSLLNDEVIVRKSHVYDKFRDWWNKPTKCFDYPYILV